MAIEAHRPPEGAWGDVTTNTIQGYFPVFKHGMRSIYQHYKSRHLPRYLIEFDLSYNHRAALEITDTMRTETAVKGIVGKRLMYRAAGGEIAG